MHVPIILQLSEIAAAPCTAEMPLKYVTEKSDPVALEPTKTFWISMVLVVNNDFSVFVANTMPLPGTLRGSEPRFLHFGSKKYDTPEKSMPAFRGTSGKILD